jgi:hypothetical protein
MCWLTIERLLIEPFVGCVNPGAEGIREGGDERIATQDRKFLKGLLVEIEHPADLQVGAID